MNFLDLIWLIPLFPAAGFVITVAAAEAAVGLGIVIAMFRNKETMNINEIDLMKW